MCAGVSVCAGVNVCWCECAGVSGCVGVNVCVGECGCGCVTLSNLNSWAPSIRLKVASLCNIPCTLA